MGCLTTVLPTHVLTLASSLLPSLPLSPPPVSNPAGAIFVLGGGQVLARVGHVGTHPCEGDRLIEQSLERR